MNVSDSGVYKIVCSVNGKLYVGSAVNFRRRFNAHLSKLRKGEHVNPKLQNAFNKHGERAFKFVILCRCRPDKRIAAEQRYIDLLKPEYNITQIAGAPPTYEWTSKQKAVAAKRAKTQFLGRHHTDDTKKLISKKAVTRLKATGHPMKGKRWTGDRLKHASTMKRLHAEGVLFSPAKVYGVSTAQKEKMRKTIAENGGRAGDRNTHYKQELDSVFVATARLIASGVSVKLAIRKTGLSRSTYYKRLKAQTI